MVVSRYVIPIGIPRVDGLSTRPPGFGVSHNSVVSGYLTSTSFPRVDGW